jgi:hypothetical protein
MIGDPDRAAVTGPRAPGDRRCGAGRRPGPGAGTFAAIHIAESTLVES